MSSVAYLMSLMNRVVSIMFFKLQPVCAGMFVSLIFGALGGAAGGAIPLGGIGAVLGTIDHGFTGVFLGTFYLGYIGGIVGFIVGLGSGAIGWLPSLIFPKSRFGSYALAVILGLLVGTVAWIYVECTQYKMDKVGLWGLLLLICGISGALASNACFTKAQDSGREEFDSCYMPPDNTVNFLE